MFTFRKKEKAEVPAILRLLQCISQDVTVYLENFVCLFTLVELFIVVCVAQLKTPACHCIMATYVKGFEMKFKDHFIFNKTISKSVGALARS